MKLYLRTLAFAFLFPTGLLAQTPAAQNPPAAPFAKSAEAPQQDASSTMPSKGCIAVKPVGSHAFRNIMLAGVAGAVISKEQYKVEAVKDYPTHVGEKFHGNDLQTIQNNGTKVMILDKHTKPEDAAKACE